MKPSLVVGFLLCTLAAATYYSEAAASDQITNLPDAPSVSFNQYGGYLTVNATTGKNLFYWFVESQKNPATDPLVFWTNGGPGCSGLIGFMTEQGPFRPQANGSLALTEYPWNKIANMVFIETPAGVGFSYSDTVSDYKIGDAQTAQDNYHAILQFFLKYPSLANNKLYITSESYGGHYMPTWAKAIVDGNAAGVNPKINFIGFAVGNPYTDPHSNNYGTFTSFYGHSLVDKVNFDKWTMSCPGNPIPCLEAEAAMELEIGNLNPYALDYPVCLTNSPAKYGRAQRLWLLNHVMPAHRKQASELPATDTYDPCWDNYAIKYLNRADVQTAIHAKPTIWTECSTKVQYNETDSFVSMEPYYLTLINDYKIKILVYSGDDDSVCATTGTQYWIYPLNYNITSPWKAWTDTDGQVGGYLVKFNGFNFVTIHTAGHEVPTYQPARGFTMFQNFLNNVW